MLSTISWPLLVWSGLVALVASTWLLMIFRTLNATRYLPRAYWSCALFATASDSALVFAGLLRMVVMIAVIPIIYVAIFAYTGQAEAVMGLMVGAAHGLLAGLTLPLAARRCSGAKAPGLLGWNLGRATPLVLLLVHATYGTLLGYIYVNG